MQSNLTPSEIHLPDSSLMPMTISKILMVDVQNDEIHIYLPDKMRVDIKIKQKNGKKVGFKPEEMENEI